MAHYRVVAATHQTIHAPLPHSHVLKVVTQIDSSNEERLWSVDEVLDAMRDGGVFYTRSGITGYTTLLLEWECPDCKQLCLRSFPDGVWENDLGNLPPCEQ